LQVARLLEAEGGLERTDDVFNLTRPELLALAEGRLSPQAGRLRAAQRRRRMEAWAAEREPEIITLYGNAAPPDSGDLNQAEDGTWRGTAVGAGRAQGRPHVAREPGDGTGMAQGDILVAPSTDPAWTPLFLKAGALVMETGGFLSHGAIVAREFGIPAVVNLPGIVDALDGAALVEVDGDRATVRRSAG
jgi:pyruvate,water dikinase